MRCLFGHRWEVHSWEPYVDTSFGLDTHHSWLYVTCKRRGVPRTLIVAGEWRK